MHPDRHRDNISPREIVERQMRAYNARDIDAYCALYAPDAVVSSLSEGKEYARGIDAVRAYYTNRFVNSPNLHYAILARMELGAFALDYERVFGVGDMARELIAIYEVRNSLIQTLRFIRA